MSKALLKPDVIAAIATPHGQGGIGVVRLSGPDLSLLAQTLIGKVPVPRHATYASFLDAQGQVMDQGIALFLFRPTFIHRRGHFRIAGARRYSHTAIGVATLS